MTQHNPFLEFVRRYQKDPVLFVQEVLGVEPDDWQKEFLTAIASGKRQISVRSGHGVGKSTAASWAMLWFFMTRYPVKVVVTAPTAAQLFDALFAELKSWCLRLPDGLKALMEVKAERLELKADPTGAFVSARTARAESPEALQGIHSENVMLVADEASGVPEAVFEAAIGSMSGEHAVTLLLGNPTRTSGFFYDSQNKNRDKWYAMRVSCLDSKRVSTSFVQSVIDSYGEESNAYRVRVLGEFPKSDYDTVMSLGLVEDAMARDIRQSPTVPVVWGLDVARMGDDATALAKRQSGVLMEPVRKWRNLDLMQTAGVVKAEWDALEEKERPVEILVDSIGLGAGVCDRLREMGLPARGINVSESPAMKGTYTNLRTELWFKAKAWFEQRGCALPKGSEELCADLVSVKYFPPNSSGKIAIESKDQTKKRLRRSPDLADAFVLTFAAEAGTAIYGTSYSSDWQKAVAVRRPVV